jgi:hypothetical protein
MPGAGPIGMMKMTPLPYRLPLAEGLLLPLRSLKRFSMVRHGLARVVSPLGAPGLLSASFCISPYKAIGVYSGSK